MNRDKWKTLLYTLKAYDIAAHHGGILKPAATLVVNGSGHNEYVLTRKKLEAMMRGRRWKP